MPKDADQGLAEAHTRGDSGGDGVAGDQARGEGGDPGGSIDLATAVRQIAGQLADPGDQPELFGEPPEAVGALEKAAENSSADRRARGAGRPKGASNKRNTQVFDYLEHIGHRAPEMTLSLIQTMDVTELAKLLQCKPIAALQLQISAAEKLLPYKLSKRPTEIAVTGEGGSGRPVMLIGEMNVSVGASDDGWMSAGRPREKTVEHQGLSDSEDVRRDEDASHETDKPLKNQG